MSNGIQADLNPCTRKRVVGNLRSSIVAKQTLLADEKNLRSFEMAVALVVGRYLDGGRMYIAGNGGSASDAQHLAGELVCKLSTPRSPLPAEALAGDCATLTAIANDFGYDEVFSRQLACKASSQDVFLALSTSGNSPNIVRALSECQRLAVPSVLFSGRDGGRAKRIADVVVIAPGDDSCRIQEVHIVLYHTLVECIEATLSGKAGCTAHSKSEWAV